MGAFALVTTAIALAMDAFAVSVCKGLATEKVRIRHMLITGLWFGGFQALMPLIGYLVGSTFASYIEAFDHWIAFGLLAIIGINMIREAFSGCDECTDASLAVSVMLPMAIATSIDALAVGVSYAVMGSVDIVFAVVSIGVITFALSALGVKLGSVFGSRYRSVAEAVGGVILILMGAKILLEHLGVL